MGIIFFKRILCLFIIIVISSVTLCAQSWNLPDNRSNNRFFSDQFNITRPALSMRSFDNTKNDSFQHQYSYTTYGVRQVLEKAYGIGQSQVESVEIVFKTFVDLWDEKFNVFDNDNNRDINSRILAARAFVALMSFIVEKNLGIFTTTVRSEFPNMPSHAHAMTKLREALLVSDKTRYFRKAVSSGNPFKRTVPLMKAARALDLYLALENA